MEVKQTYLEQLNSNFDLGIKLVQKKIRKLEEEIKAYERYISHLEKNLQSYDEEINQLKDKCKVILSELKKYQNHLELKEEALVIHDN
ncbi:hypothetical protein GLOIN_2v1885507 [Rhizophagus clarus]|uniref:Uncharacterized protein n=1 Tax=Rhizophagus clarus TaxID=94130 RepID=A0A8H3QZR8_9GLOM|nr:hypothetical protein GLOIN_2v1885507 [Rhizophagus clarus]